MLSATVSVALIRYGVSGFRNSEGINAMTMLEIISEWMRLMNLQFDDLRRPCTAFKEPFAGYFPESFLAQTHYVVVPQMPVPAYQFLEQHGLTDLFNRDVAGLTLNNTYYLLPSVENNLRVHFHELVHVAQWQRLGVEGFVTRYLQELQAVGYDKMPLERMAYDLDAQYAAGGPVVHVPDVVNERLSAG